MEIDLSHPHESTGRSTEQIRKGISGRIGNAAGIPGYIDRNASPRFCKGRTAPYAMQQLVEKELDRLVDEGILEPVQFAEWAAPIVPVLKSDRKTVRICGDFSQTVNKAAKVDAYQIPKIIGTFSQK